jgi:hypothetical protein
MTLTLASTPKLVQGLGVLLAAVATLAAGLSSYCGSSIHASAGIALVILGIGGLLIRHGDGAIPIALLQVVVLLVSLSVVISCAPVLNAPTPLLPVDVIFDLFVASVGTAFVGALLVRCSR